MTQYLLLSFTIIESSTPTPALDVSPSVTVKPGNVFLSAICTFVLQIIVILQEVMAQFLLPAVQHYRVIFPNASNKIVTNSDYRNIVSNKTYLTIIPRTRV